MSTPSPSKHQLARRIVLKRLQGLRGGTVRLVEGGSESALGDGSAPQVSLHVVDPVLWRDVLTGGGPGAGEAYAAGAWHTDDLPGLLQILMRNRDVLEALDGGAARLTRPLLRLARRFGPSSRAACRRYIAAHYDLGNAFFAAFLDPSMTYSCGFFEHPDSTMEEASRAKYARLASRIGLAPGMRVLEIGCGWGGFAEYAAREHGCEVDATTISKEQGSYARDRTAQAGLGDRVRILDQDYRDLTGTYDRVVSIEMVEAIGAPALPLFARQCADRLTPDGMLALQAITLDDRHYARALRRTDFIQRYIFPGSFIPSTSALNDAFVGHTDLRLRFVEDIGAHYETTLSHWRARFLERSDAIRAMGFEDAFLRLWDYYFAYCEAGYRERFLGDLQMVFTAPAATAAPWSDPVPSTRRATPASPAHEVATTVSLPVPTRATSTVLKS